MAEQAAVTATPAVVRVRKVADVSTVAASGFASGVIPIKKTVQSIHFRFLSSGSVVLTRAQLITDIASVRILMSGTPIVDLTATQILNLYKYYLDQNGELSAPLGELVIPFNRWNLPVWGLNRAFGLGMIRKSGGYHTLSYEISYTAGLTTAASCQVYVMHDVEKEEPLGFHVRAQRSTRSFAGTGEQAIEDLPTACVGVLGYHFDTSAMASFSVVKDGDIVFDQVPCDTMNVAARAAGRTGVSAQSHIAFDLTNDVNGFEPLGRNIREWSVKPNWSSAPGTGYGIVRLEIYDDIE